jgi:hypothetical protein
LESHWKWKAIEHTELAPLTASHQNKDYPWIIISGKQDIGKYCKALSCPKLAEDADTTDLWFLVALARIEMWNGERMTVVEEPMQERRIRQGDLRVVFRSLKERKKEPMVYEGVRAAARKRKNVPNAEAAPEQARAVDSDVEGPAAKKRRIGDVEADDEGDEAETQNTLELDLRQGNGES